jgi:NADH:ubiquinone oxidoreductase subunit E
MEEKINITICLGSSCFARGNNKNLEFVQEYLKGKQPNR